MCRVLDAVDNDQAFGRLGPDRLSNGGNIDGHSSNRTCLNDGCDPCVFTHMRCVVLRRDHCPIFVMGDADVLFSCDGTPSAAGTRGRRMLKRAADDVAASGGAQYRRPYQTKKQFGSALAGKHHAIFDTKEGFHVLTGLVDDPHQFMRGGIIPTLIIRNGREVAVDFDNRFQRQRSARVFKEDSRSLIGTMIHMVEAITNLA